MALVEQAEADRGPDGTPPAATPAATAGDGGSILGQQRSSRSLMASEWEASRGAGLGGRMGDAAALVRRARALGVPPLPPNLGAVR